MATNTKNVLVGAADLFLSKLTGDARPNTEATDLTTILPSGQSARTGLLGTSGSALYSEVGFTSTGLEISYEPVYGEVMVDQLLDAARLFKQTLKVMMKTELVEATLENLQISWGQSDTYYVNKTGSSVTGVPTLDPTLVQSGDSLENTLSIAAGALGDAPVERTLIAVGNAPGVINGDKTKAAYRNKERVYVARRVVSIDTTAHGLKRDSATVFPVNFRCLPDDRKSSYAGSEYGIVIDRVWGNA